MHRPPAVSYSVVRSRWHARTLGVLWGLGVLSVQLALWRYEYSGAALAIMECACLLTGLWAVWAWRTAPQGLLRWDGDYWHWSGYAEVPAHQVRVHVDFQTVALASVQGPGGECVWLWLERVPASRTQWLALRRALVAGRTPPLPTMPREQLP